MHAAYRLSMHLRYCFRLSWYTQAPAMRKTFYWTVRSFEQESVEVHGFVAKRSSVSPVLLQPVVESVYLPKTSLTAFPFSRIFIFHSFKAHTSFQDITCRRRKGQALSSGLSIVLLPTEYPLCFFGARPNEYLRTDTHNSSTRHWILRFRKNKKPV